MQTFAVIMAGGGGTRFWPLSRQNRPKQLLNITGKELMINETIDRLLYVLPPENILVITNALQCDTVRQAVGGRLAADHVLAEPCARDTAACVGYAAAYIQARWGESVMVITPSDAYIRDTQTFSRVLRHVVDTVSREDRMMTIGITPTYPATGYGYIQHSDPGEDGICPVYAFREKPNQAVAEGFLKQGCFKWNSGMFIWRTDRILAQFRKLAPDLAQPIERIGSAVGTADEQAVLNDLYPQLRKISVDYAILEDSARDGMLSMLEGDFGWSDIGSWDAMDTVRQADEHGNVVMGEEAVFMDTKGCVVYSQSKPVAMLAVSDTVVVDTGDVLLVCAKDRAQDIKQMVQLMQQKGHAELL